MLENKKITYLENQLKAFQQDLQDLLEESKVFLMKSDRMENKKYIQEVLDTKNWLLDKGSLVFHMIIQRIREKELPPDTFLLYKEIIQNQADILHIMKGEVSSMEEVERTITYAKNSPYYLQSDLKEEE